MDFQHTLLLLLFVLPLAYKIAFWKEIFSCERTILLSMKEGYGHFWTYIEFPLFLGSFFVYLKPDTEIFFFNFLLYLFAMMHIFLFGKIFRGEKTFGKEPLFHIILGVLSSILCFFAGDFGNILLIYASMAFFYIVFSLYLGLKQSYK